MGFMQIDIDYKPESRRLHPYNLHCPGCGKFAKFGGIRYGYNGWYDTETLTTHCKKCGDITTEMV